MTMHTLSVDRLVSIFKALADENRFRIIEMLLRGDLCVSALAHRLGISKPAVSQHLQILSRVGLVTGERRGYWTHYVVDRKMLNRIGITVTEISERRPQQESRCLRRLPVAQEIQSERRVNKMCMACCQRPQKLKGKPSECSLDQIKECHGDTETHPCVGNETGNQEKES